MNVSTILFADCLLSRICLPQHWCPTRLVAHQVTHQLATRSGADSTPGTRPQQIPLAPSSSASVEGPWGLYTAERFACNSGTILVMHGLIARVSTCKREKNRLASVLDVRVPLSDWALKYISTVCNHPPGRRTRRMSPK